MIHSSLDDLSVFLAFDYSQIEIRELAEVSKDPLLIQQFRSGEDIHCLVGNTLTGWPTEKIKKDHDTRRTIKTFHFAIVYGVGEDSMYTRLKAEGLSVSRSTVHSYFQKYFQRYKGVKRFIDRSRHTAQTKHYAETLFGFRRSIRETDETRGSYWANQAINTPIQGTAHQLVLIALALLDLKPRTYNFLQKPVMEVHDALFWKVRLRNLKEAFRQGKQLLEKGVVAYAKRGFGIQLQVPLVAEAKAGFCLGSMVDYAGESQTEFLKTWRDCHNKVEKASWEKLYHL